MDNTIGNFISQKRKELGYTQQNLADHLHISFQAVSRWEKGTAAPDISLLPSLASILNCSTDALLGYQPLPRTDYENRYQEKDYYWGIIPNDLCYRIMKLKPPIKPWRVLDIGCGEGKDAVFLAKNGYQISAFDVADAGLEKARRLAELNQADVHFFKADLLEYCPDSTFDIIYSSGVLHYLPPAYRKKFLQALKDHTSLNGINVLNVFVDKPFLTPPPDQEPVEADTPPLAVR